VYRDPFDLGQSVEPETNRFLPRRPTLDNRGIWKCAADERPRVLQALLVDDHDNRVYGGRQAPERPPDHGLAAQ
jgi:hypothetical protein